MVQTSIYKKNLISYNEILEGIKNNDNTAHPDWGLKE